jgi:hypothetical protein
MKSRRRGGSSFPLQYYNSKAPFVSGPAGTDMQSYGNIIRPHIPMKGGSKGGLKGGSRRKRSRGGFVPSVMEGFVALTSKYITPLALFSGYKLMTRKKSKKGKKSKNKR